MRTKMLIAPALLLLSCSNPQNPAVQPPQRSDSTATISRIGDSLVVLGKDTFVRLANVIRPQPVSVQKKSSAGDAFIGTWKCTESFCSDQPYTITIRKGDGDYLVTLDKKRDNLEGAPRTFPMRYDAGLLTYNGEFGSETIEFAAGNTDRIRYKGKWGFVKAGN